MSRFLLLDTGEELGEATSQQLGSVLSPIRLRLLEPAPPFREGQILQVRASASGGIRAGAFFLCRAGSGVLLRRVQDRPARRSEEVLGRVVAVEKGPHAFSLERGLLAWVPPRWLPRAVDALEVLARFRHPLTPSLYLGQGETCLAGVREKYDRQGEARQYSNLAHTGLDPLERETVERHVKPGGRLLDIGCGAGREALGFARLGFRVVGIDIAPRMIEAARENARREGLEITFRVQNAADLDDPPGSFDGVFWAGSFHHVPGRALRVSTLRRIATALAPGGALVLMVIYRGRRGLLSRSRIVDVLRRGGACLGRTFSEPGDGYMREVSEASDPREPVFFHDFSGPQGVREEIEAADLQAEEVAQGWWVCWQALPG
jgi:SAM-dependent methyltransferase